MNRKEKSDVRSQENMPETKEAYRQTTGVLTRADKRVSRQRKEPSMRKDSQVQVVHCSTDNDSTSKHLD